MFLNSIVWKPGDFHSLGVKSQLELVEFPTAQRSQVSTSPKKTLEEKRFQGQPHCLSLVLIFIFQLREWAGENCYVFCWDLR